MPNTQRALNTPDLLKFNNRKPSGFSLLETLVTLCIAGVILGVAVPAVGPWTERQRLRSMQTALLQMIHRARYQALTQHQRITLCPLSQTGNCQQDWNQSISSFVDQNSNRKLDPGEQLLSTVDVPASIKLHWRGMSPNNSMHFTPLGFTALSNGTMSLCPLMPSVIGATITVNVQGRAKTQQGYANCPHK